MGAVDSPFYRTGIGMPPGYPGYTPGLLHPGLGGPTPFAPPNHLPPFAPKVSANALRVAQNRKQPITYSRMKAKNQSATQVNTYYS